MVGGGPSGGERWKWWSRGDYCTCGYKLCVVVLFRSKYGVFFCFLSMDWKMVRACVCWLEEKAAGWAIVQLLEVVV